MKNNCFSQWDYDQSIIDRDEFAKEIYFIDQANRRKRKALKQMNKALQRKNEYIIELEDKLIEDMCDNSRINEALEFEYVLQNELLKEW